VTTDPEATDVKRGDEVTLEGVTICPGIGISSAHVLNPEIEVAKEVIEPDRVPAEQQRYTRAVEVVHEQLRAHVEEAHEELFPEAGFILKAHEAMLADEQFHDNVRNRIATDHRNAEWAVEDEGKELIKRFEATRDSYFRARAEDTLDMVTNILLVLSRAQASPQPPPPRLRESQVLICGHLYPSNAMVAQRSGAVGFATESQALSAHAAILLKGFGIPTVGGVSGLKEAVREGDEVIIDAINGLVILRPRQATREKYVALKKKLEAPGKVPPPAPCSTRDGIRVRLMANIKNPHQIQLVFQNGLEGIGLFRTEFFLLTSERFPTEEEQYEIYRRVISASSGRRVVIRTFDIGADKQSPSLYRCIGENPALGVRGIRRHLLLYPEEFRTQIRAILRAGPDEKIGILLPMITTVDDLRQARRQVEIAKEELNADGSSFSEDFQLGAMIEVPAAAIATREILAEVDFLSVGTNDLLQYFMAADRDNESVLQYSHADNDAFVWLLRHIIEQAGDLGREKDVTICGEMASRPHLIPLLLQLGYRSLSISPVAAGRVRDAIASVDLGQSNK